MTIKHIDNIITSITWNTYVSETAPLRSAELTTTIESQIKFEKRSYRYTAHITGRRALAWFEPCGRAEPRLEAGRGGVLDRLGGRVATGPAMWDVAASSSLARVPFPCHGPGPQLPGSSVARGSSLRLHPTVHSLFEPTCLVTR
jgi:hypothetical protein